MADRRQRKADAVIALITRLQGSRPCRDRPHFPVYLRISSDPQGTNLAVERQLEDCWPLAEKLAKGLPIEVYCDSDVSAVNPYEGLSEKEIQVRKLTGKLSKYERSEYAAMVGALQDGRSPGFATYRFDRVCRSPYELEGLIQLVEGRKDTLKIAAASGGDYDLTTVNGRLTARLLASVARHEVELTRDRRLRQIRQAREWGLCLTPVPPGYVKLEKTKIEVWRDPDGKLRKNNLQVVPADAEVIRAGWDAIFGTSAYGAGPATLGMVTRTWNQHQWEREAKQDSVYRSRPWTVATVLNTLCSATLAARIEAGNSASIEADLPGAWVPILSWEQVQRARRFRDARRTGSRGGRKHASLLTGFLECGVCGSRQFARNRHHHGAGPETFRYSCNGARKDQPELADGVKPWHLSRKCDVVDRYVVRQFLDRLQAYRAEVLTDDHLGDTIRHWEDELRTVDAESAEVNALAGDPDPMVRLPRRDAAIQLAALEARRQKASIELARLARVSPLARFASAADPGQAWDDADLEEQRLLLGLVIDTVVLLPTGRSTAVTGSRPANVPPGKKWCRKCGGVWPVADYYPDKGSKDGRMARCIRCVSQDAARRYQEAKQGRRANAPDSTISIVFRDIGAGSDGHGTQDGAGHPDRGTADG